MGTSVCSDRRSPRRVPSRKWTPESTINRRRPLGAAYPSDTEKTMKKLGYASIAIVLAAFGALAFSHGGGLDKNGCHTDHKTGVYHCH